MISLLPVFRVFSLVACCSFPLSLCRGGQSSTVCGAPCPGSRFCIAAHMIHPILLRPGSYLAALAQERRSKPPATPNAPYGFTSHPQHSAELQRPNRGTRRHGHLQSVPAHSASHPSANAMECWTGGTSWGTLPATGFVCILHIAARTPHERHVRKAWRAGFARTSSAPGKSRTWALPAQLRFSDPWWSLGLLRPWALPR